LLSVDPKTDRYAFSYKIETTSEGIKIIEEPKERGDAKQLLSDLWQRIKGN